MTDDTVPVHAADGVGLPYAPGAFDDLGRYHVVCPVCGLRCYSTEDGNEDLVTKGASVAYAAHFASAMP